MTPGAGGDFTKGLGVGSSRAGLWSSGVDRLWDVAALAALEELCEAEVILTALETSHAYAAAKQWARENPGKKILIGNSGRGDKDMPTLTKYPAKVRAHAAT